MHIPYNQGYNNLAVLNFTILMKIEWPLESKWQKCRASLHVGKTVESSQFVFPVIANKQKVLVQRAVTSHVDDVYHICWTGISHPSRFGD